jgi:ATP-dependent Clp protease ATP-binding subunit ClpA
MIAQELEVSLHMAFVEARQKRHEFITVEHLLLALLDNPTAAEVLRACGANMEELRKSLLQYVTEQTPKIAADREVDTQPTLGFQRVIQRAILHVQSSGKKEVTGANVLVAIFGEKDSHAVYYLQQQGVARLDVVNFISHGITKTPQAGAGKSEQAARHLYAEPERARSGGKDRPADRTRARAGARDSNALPAAQEQSAAGRGSRSRQDGDRGRPRTPHRRGRRARVAEQIDRLRA